MISLLAQTSQTVQLPASFYGLSATALGGLVGLAIVMGKVLGGLRRLRSDVAKEVKLELDAAAQAQRVDVQQPLTVAPLVAYVEKPDYDRDQRTNDERHKAAKESREKIHGDLKGHEARIASLEKGEKHTDAALAVIDQKVTIILQRLPQKKI
ncbi:hypothetical protein OpiT1DRAFT_03982 [Opitutaceae bacterium TAV1]|nr:hypothetical protein OpiT1DRAFT_03982 [Opitutaceae bacterium TAV1]